MPLVAFDTMIIDQFADAIDVDERWAASMEAMEPPPLELPPQPWAMYWLVALAPAWRSCVYTFSDRLYGELEAMPPTKAGWASRLLGLAIEIREAHPQEARVVNEASRPPEHQLAALGLKAADSAHLADAIGVGASHFLTLDKAVLRRASSIEAHWGLQIMTPAEFLIWSVRHGAPWPSFVLWPWESGPLAELIRC